MDETYLRLHADYRGRLDVEVGIFVAVDHLRRADLLSVQEEETYFDVDDWFNLHLPNPPFYDDGNSIQAVTWFKRSTTASMLVRLEPLARILTAHRVAWHLAETDDPGPIVYEDNDRTERTLVDRRRRGERDSSVHVLRTSAPTEVGTAYRSPVLLAAFGDQRDQCGDARRCGWVDGRGRAVLPGRRPLVWPRVLQRA